MVQLGLNSYEAKAYLALLGRDSFSATQVAELSGVPRQRVYDILSSLVERGLAVSRPGNRGLKYAAVAPAVALAALLEQERRHLAALQESTEILMEDLSAQYQEGKAESGSLEYIEVLRGPNAINQRFADIQQRCREELLIFTKPPYAKPLAENEEGLKALNRRIRARSLYEYEVLQERETRETIALFIQQGEEARFVNYLPLKLVIVDEEQVMVAMEDPIAGRTEMTVMVIENSPFAQLLKVAFEALWERGDSLARSCEHMGLPVPVVAG